MMSLSDLHLISESINPKSEAPDYSDKMIDEACEYFTQVIIESAETDALKVKLSAQSKLAVKKFKEAKKLYKKDPEAAKKIAKESVTELEDIKKVAEKISDDSQASLIIKWLLISLGPFIISLILDLTGHFIGGIIFSGLSITGSSNIINKTGKSQQYEQDKIMKDKSKSENEKYYAAVNKTLSGNGISRNNLMSYYDHMIDMAKKIANDDPNTLKADIAKLNNK